MNKLGTGSLFQTQAKSSFMLISGKKYDSLVDRMDREKLPPPPFSKEQFRWHVQTHLGDHRDGVIQCRYCKRYCTLAETACDHAVPLSRGGSLDLSNLEFPCQNCNQAKGSMRPEEFLALLKFLEREIPLARTDVLGRLAKAVSLAIGMRRNMARINELKQSGQWKTKKKAKAKPVEEPF